MLKKNVPIIPLLLLFDVLLFFTCAPGWAGNTEALKKAAFMADQKIYWYERGIKKYSWMATDEFALFLEKKKKIEKSFASRLNQHFPDALETKKNSFVRFLKTRSFVGKKRFMERLDKAQGLPGIHQISPVFYRSPSKKTDEQMVLSGEIIVQFPKSFTDTQIQAIEQVQGLKRLKLFDFTNNTFKYWVGHGLKSLNIANRLFESGKVKYAYPNWLRTRSKKATPDDPKFPSQWHLVTSDPDTGRSGVNATSAWDTCKGSADEVIAIVDDGVEISHEDLADNILPEIGWDFVDGDADPSPEAEDDNHGTACAGVAAGRGFNGIGISGAAPFAGIISHRLLGAETDANEAAALTLNSQLADIYSNSWGPYDIPHLEGPGPLTEDALAAGTASGRGGLGNIFVWAGGNGKEDGDNSNYDGFANSRFTIAVAASDNYGRQAYYSEPGANILINAPSSSRLKGIVTTDRTGLDGYIYSNYYSNFGGTSSSTALVSGVIALVLEANPNLSWRDVQHLLLFTADQNDPSDADWTANGAGYWVNHKYGFGRINAADAVEQAASWVSAGTETSTRQSSAPNLLIPDYDYTGVTDTISITDDINIEFVEIYFTCADHPSWGDLEIILTSPEGTQSILSERSYSVGDDTPYVNWRFGSLRHFGESSLGDWTLTVRDKYKEHTGTFQSWDLKIYGTANGAEDRLQFSTNFYSVCEGDGSININVTRKGLCNGRVSVDYDTVDGAAVAGADYIAASGTLVFEDGEREKSFSVTVLDNSRFDVDDEGTETIKLKLSNPSAGAVVGNPGKARLWLTGSTPPKIVVDDLKNGASDVWAADIDGDGDMDIIGAASDYNGGIDCWKNADGSGSTWNTCGSFSDGFSSVRAADMDGDGDLDIVASSENDREIVWWENTDGSGSFGSETYYYKRKIIADGLNRYLSISVADIDGDGDMDVIGAEYRSSQIFWWENYSNGTSWQEREVGDDSTYSSASSVHAMDMDKDGDMDIVCTQDGISWWENTDGEGRSWRQHIVYDGRAYDVFAADIDRDGDMDIVASSYDTGLAWWENQDGIADSWIEHSVDLDSGRAPAVQAADLDQDGDMDILCAVNDEIAWWENADGLGSSWQEHIAVDNFEGASAVFAADVDGDGDLDIIGAGSGAEEIAWWENTLPILSLTLPEQGVGEGDGVLINQGTVHLQPASGKDVIVTLLSDDTSEIRVPPTVIVPAGRTTANFDLMIQDDTLLDGSVLSTITASAAGYRPGSRQMAVHDNESAVLTVQIPETAKEGDGLLAGQGIVLVNRIVDADVTIYLASSDTTAVNVPETVILPGGTDSVAFDLQVVEDDVCADTQSATITASVNAWTCGTDTIVIEDGSSKISFPISFAHGYEKYGIASVNVVRDNCLDLPVTVSYATSDGTATAGLDYEPIAGTLTFASRERVKSLSIVIIDDDLYEDEGHETIVLSLSNTSVGGSLGDLRTIPLYIYDNDPVKHIVDTEFNNARSVHAADMDGDGDMDVLGAAGSDYICLWENTDGTGTAWSRRTVDSYFRGATFVCAVDMDNDGDLDILGAASEDDDIKWWENRDAMARSWSAHTVANDFNGARFAAAVDLDGDGDLDVMGVAAYEDGLAWWENTGEAVTWMQRTITGNFDRVYALSAADMDGDGDLDIVGSVNADYRVMWWENAGTQATNWVEHTIESDIGASPSIIAVDLDKDGDMDVIGSEYSGSISWWENLGGLGNAWHRHGIDQDLYGPRINYVGDIDGDGNLDIAGVVNPNMYGGTVYWWKNPGGSGGSWEKKAISDKYDFEGAQSSYAADMDGDGDLDVLGAAYSDDTIAWWQNPLYTACWLQVSKDGAGTGHVSSIQEGIDCGSKCSSIYAPGTWVSLTATPDSDSAFTGWSGGGCSGTDACIILMDEMKTIWATFGIDGDGDGIADDIDPDDDNDGMPDEWENMYTGLDAYTYDALDDLDGDGFCNLREYLSGASPLDSTSIPDVIGDFDGDFDVDALDMLKMSLELGRHDCLSTGACLFDFNMDGSVDHIDLKIFSEDYGRGE